MTYGDAGGVSAKPRGGDRRSKLDERDLDMILASSFKESKTFYQS